jgi:hypothetical protein
MTAQRGGFRCAPQFNDRRVAHARTAASAADMMRPIPYKAAPMAAAPTWTGFYLGVNVGGAFGEDLIDFGVVGAPAFASANNAFHGIIGGGQVGYNWQFTLSSRASKRTFREAA